MNNGRELLSYSFNSTKKKMNRLLHQNYKVVTEKLKEFSDRSLKGYSVFGSWYFNDSLTQLESLYLFKQQVKDEMNNRGLTPLWCEEPLKEFDKTLKFKK